MAHTKAGGSTQNNRDSQPKYLGVKLYAGEAAKSGAIIVRQRGTRFIAGAGTRMGCDHTIYSIREGKVQFEQRRKNRFDGSRIFINRISVV
ncbi:MAG TPA: 50S ribosomal protein L27 [Candidatus Paceibacterota bacterium]